MLLVSEAHAVWYVSVGNKNYCATRSDEKEKRYICTIYNCYFDQHCACVTQTGPNALSHGLDSAQISRTRVFILILSWWVSQYWGSL